MEPLNQGIFRDFGTHMPRNCFVTLLDALFTKSAKVHF